MNMPALKDILPGNLIPGLRPAEKIVLETARAGEVADVSSKNKEENDPEKADQWVPERTIRPEFLYWLCTDEAATKLVHAKGVQIIGAKVDGDLDFNSATIPRPFKMIGCAFKEIILRDAETRFLGFKDCTTGAITADRLSTKGGLFLRGTKVSGTVRLLGADIGGDLSCTGAEFENKDGYALNCENARIKGTLFLNEMKSIQGSLDLMHAKAGTLVDDKTGWPENGKLLIDGFEYGGLPGNTTTKTARERIEWLRLQPKKNPQGSNVFFPQPYEQLAKVFRDMGQESYAKEVLIAKHDDMRNSGALDFGQYCRSWFMGLTLRHGYYPWRVVGFMVVMLVLGVFLFDRARALEVMQPSKERVYMDPNYKGLASLPEQYPKFNCIVYSLDAFVPVADLHQEDYWLPDAKKPYGGFFRFYLWAHIISGWLSSTLIIVYLTGLVRKE